jgi:hypothetical protein
LPADEIPHMADTAERIIELMPTTHRHTAKPLANRPTVLVWILYVPPVRLERTLDGF